jgi:hypothetical protein
MATFTASGGVRFTDTDGGVTFVAGYQTVGGGGGGGATTLNGLDDVVITAAASGDILRHNGTNWVDVDGTTIFDAAGTAASAVAALSSVYQPLDSDLTAIAALSTTSYGRAFLALADAAAGRTALGLGTAATSASGDFQPIDSDLTAIAALSTTSYGRAFLALADAAAGRTALGLGDAATKNVGTTAGSVMAGDTTIPAAYTDEQVRDVIGTALVAGSNVTITPNDGADTITIAAASSGGPFGGASTYSSVQSYMLPGVYFTALANAVALTANRIWYVPFLIRSGTLTVDRMHCEVTTNVAATNLRMGVYSADTTWQATGAALIDVTASSATTGSKNVTVSSVALAPGRYLACIVSDGAISVRSAASIQTWGSDHGGSQVTTPGSAQVLTARAASLTYGALPNSGPAWTMVTATATPAAAANEPVLLLRGTFS